MTDKEMLRLCLDAFKAIPTAHASRSFMTQHGMSAELWGGSGSYQLAKAMFRRLSNHLLEEGE